MSDFQIGCTIGLVGAIYIFGVFGTCRTIKRQVPESGPPAPARFFLGLFWPLIVIGVGVAEVLFDIRTADSEKTT